MIVSTAVYSPDFEDWHLELWDVEEYPELWATAELYCQTMELQGYTVELELLDADHPEVELYDQDEEPPTPGYL